jgi:tRNA(fMet)-specific endonuclease VapC
MKYLLDTDTISYLFQGRETVVSTFVEMRPSSVAISAISVAELRLGARRKGSKKINNWLDVFFENVTVLPFDQAAAEVFGQTANKLLRAGTPIGQNDTMIASQALANNLSVVTHNQKHFSRISGLKTEDWF